MIYKVLILLCAVILHCGAYASRGWYVSVGGLSAAQSHTVSDYSYSQDVLLTGKSSVSAAPSVPSSNIYWFKQDSTTNNGINSYSNFTGLQSALNGKYIINSISFKVNNELTDGTSAPSFAFVSGGGNGTITANASPSNTTGGSVAGGVLTYTYGGSTQVIGTINRLTSSPSFYQVTLSPVTPSAAAYKNGILLEMDSQTKIRTQKQVQDFVELFNDQSSRTAEVSIGYKFRPVRSPFFLAPQVDFTYFKNNTINNTAYMNPTTKAISLTPKSSNAQLVSYGNFDLSYTASLIFKLGFEQRFWFFGAKVPFSLYGLFGGSSSFRTINNIRDNAFGLKYGIGGELFVSEQLAFFTELYQIQYLRQNYIVDKISNYTGTALNTTDGLSVNITNNGTGTGEKILTVNYPSSSQAFTAQTKTTEQFKLQSQITAIKLGLTYYVK